MATRIFIGSSSEAKGVVRLVEAEIERVLGQGSALPWNDGSFDQGVVTLAAIEDLPNKVAGAVLCATPNVDCNR
jgi:predicted nucleotide-binding protein